METNLSMVIVFVVLLVIGGSVALCILCNILNFINKRIPLVTEKAKRKPEYVLVSNRI
jgi:hypothetical protein